MITRVPTIDQSDMEFVYGDSQPSTSFVDEVSNEKVIQEDTENPARRNSNPGKDFTSCDASLHKSIIPFISIPYLFGIFGTFGTFERIMYNAGQCQSRLYLILEFSSLSLGVQTRVYSDTARTRGLR